MNEPAVANLLNGLRSTTATDSQMRIEMLMHRAERPQGD